MPKSRGFTLIELLVVISIMAVVGAYALSNYRSFGEDQKLKNAVLDVVSLLRQAQTNATTNAKCDASYGATWQVVFSTISTANLKCSASISVIKPLILGTNITSSVTVTGTDCPYPSIVNFDPVTGKVGLGDPDCTALSVALTNGTDSKAVIIKQGGQIYAQ